jgi:hypothetical protein
LEYFNVPNRLDVPLELGHFSYRISLKYNFCVSREYGFGGSIGRASLGGHHWEGIIGRASLGRHHWEGSIGKAALKGQH